MELTRLTDIKLDDVTKDLYKDLEETARQVNDFRPLSESVLQSVHQELLGDRVYSSNAIEGNTLERRETIEILKTGHIDVAKRREATEVVNLGKAIGHTSEFRHEQVASVDQLLKVHHLLLAGINDEWAGHIRNVRVLISGAKHQPPDDRQVQELLNSLFGQLSQDDTIPCPLLATWCHWGIARIHPFHDGNGRMARLWQDLILFNGRLTCAIIRPEDRREYLDALGAADEGEFNPLCQLVAQRVAKTFDMYLTAQQQEDALGTWATEIVGESEARLAESRRLEYMRWSRKMEELRYAFERCASLISDKATDAEIQVWRYDIVDQSAWENLRSGMPTSRTWYFKLVFRKANKFLTYFFFVGKHFWGDADNDQDRSKPHACLLISEGDRGGVAIRLDQFKSAPLSIREIFVSQDQFVRKRYDATQGEDTYDRGISPTKIAQDFISEVMLERLAP